jgi:hypothetical protein
MHFLDDAIDTLLTQGGVLSTGRSALSVEGGGSWGQAAGASAKRSAKAMTFIAILLEDAYQ